MTKKLVITKIDTTQLTDLASFGAAFGPIIGQLTSMGVKFALIDPSKQDDGSCDSAITERYTASLWDDVSQMLAFSQGEIHKAATGFMKPGEKIGLKSVDIEDGLPINTEFVLSQISEHFGLDLSGVSEYAVYDNM